MKRLNDSYESEADNSMPSNLRALLFVVDSETFEEKLSDDDLRDDEH